MLIKSMRNPYSVYSEFVTDVSCHYRFPDVSRLPDVRRVCRGPRCGDAEVSDTDMLRFV